MSRNLDTIRRLIPKLKEGELTIVRKMLSQEFIGRDLKRESSRAMNRLYTLLERINRPTGWDPLVLDDYEDWVKGLSEMTEHEFMLWRGAGQAVLLAAKLELSRRNLSFKIEHPETTEP